MTHAMFKRHERDAKKKRREESLVEAVVELVIAVRRREPDNQAAARAVKLLHDLGIDRARDPLAPK